MADQNTAVQKQKPKTSPARMMLIVLLGAALAVGLSLIFSGILFPHPNPIHKRLMCGMNMAGLGKAMMLYAEDFGGQYPTPEKWCDLLIEYEEVQPKQFVCKGSGAKVGESSYAFNKNLAGKKASEVPPDVVLLFETKKGWNQVGGPEILTTENHEGQGCNVLFSDANVEFRGSGALGELKWTVEKRKTTPRFEPGELNWDFGR